MIDPKDEMPQKPAGLSPQDMQKFKNMLTSPLATMWIVIIIVAVMGFIGWLFGWSK
jgi:type IV secretory pathway VirB2 component (pilin)